MIITEVTVVSKLEQSREKLALQSRGREGMREMREKEGETISLQHKEYRTVSYHTNNCLTCWNFGTRRRFTVHLSHRLRVRVLYAGIRGTKGKPGEKGGRNGFLMRGSERHCS